MSMQNNAKPGLNLQLTWPEIFVTGKEPLSIKNHPHRLHLLCADGLCGWACATLEMRPDKFGEGMVHIGAMLGVSLREALMQWPKDHPLPELTKAMPKRRHYTVIFANRTHQLLRKNFNWNSMSIHIRHDGSISNSGKKNRYFYYELNRGNGR